MRKLVAVLAFKIMLKNNKNSVVSWIAFMKRTSETAHCILEVLAALRTPSF
jgi:hypothetical protein